MTTDWLLISTFGGQEPSLIGVGSSPKPFVPLGRHFKGRRSQPNRALDDVQNALLEIMADPEHRRIDRESEDGRKRILAEPLLNSESRLHGVYFWRGDTDEAPPPRDPAGAWHFNLTAGKASGSDDLFDLYGVAPEDRRSEAALAGAFTRLVTNRDEGEALAKIVQSEPGTEHQAVWKVRRDDGEERAAHFSCRMLEEKPDPAGDRREVILRGITHDIGPAGEVPAAPPPVILEHRVLDAVLTPGEYLAYVDLKRLALIKWRSEPMPGVAWEDAVGEPAPAMHPSDVPLARKMAKDLAYRKVEGILRFRGLDGDWKPLHLSVALMAFDESTHGGLVTVTEAPTPQNRNTSFGQ
ncbi:hypothetical protein DEU38_13612 [Rhodococcus sp. AG1013]|uniref:GAF domain-containing protein n=1 Tax=Rhodococcus sp. AG1013 TaxID=2183996 RepID=UPI000E0B14A4|nr:GAF domain-containing protein [Rhodococcus sp. AG1013]RDI12361.1 hypothetical protein DEU38_13612 [Rhodococcus sp. AG1013]